MIQKKAQSGVSVTDFLGGGGGERKGGVESVFVKKLETTSFGLQTKD